MDIPTNKSRNICDYPSILSILSKELNGIDPSTNWEALITEFNMWSSQFKSHGGFASEVAIQKLVDNKCNDIVKILNVLKNINKRAYGIILESYTNYQPTKITMIPTNNNVVNTPQKKGIYNDFLNKLNMKKYEFDMDDKDLVTFFNYVQSKYDALQFYTKIKPIKRGKFYSFNLWVDCLNTIQFPYSTKNITIKNGSFVRTITNYDGLSFEFSPALPLQYFENRNLEVSFELIDEDVEPETVYVRILSFILLNENLGKPPSDNKTNITLVGPTQNNNFVMTKNENDKFVLNL